VRVELGGKQLELVRKERELQQLRRKTTYEMFSYSFAYLASGVWFVISFYSLSYLVYMCLRIESFSKLFCSPLFCVLKLSVT